jgi:hypothetical protein
MLTYAQDFWKDRGLQIKFYAVIGVAVVLFVIPWLVGLVTILTNII